MWWRDLTNQNAYMGVQRAHRGTEPWRDAEGQGGAEGYGDVEGMERCRGMWRGMEKHTGRHGG